MTASITEQVDDYWIDATRDGYWAKFDQPTKWQITDTGEVLQSTIAEYKVRLTLLRITVNNHIGRIVQIRVWDGKQYSVPPSLRIDQRALISGSCFNALRYMIDDFDWQFCVMITGDHPHGVQCSINHDIEDQMKWTKIRRCELIDCNGCSYYIFTRTGVQLSRFDKQIIVERISNET